jgi:DNA mismatch endonuclease (patch repair protein)
MRLIRKRDTGPERRVRSTLHLLGFRFRLHRSDLPGTPDLVLPRFRVAVFVHGCFWHQHEGCRLARQPKSRPDYWLPKFERNRRRDAANADALKRFGWRPVVIWECEANDEQKLRRRLLEVLSTELSPSTE